MIARSLPNRRPTFQAPASSGWARFGLAALIAAHAAADVWIALEARSSLGLKGFWVFPLVAGGVACGQAVLLGQLLLLGRRRFVLRISLVAGWFALLYYLARPIFTSVGGPRAAIYDDLASIAAPFILAALSTLIHVACGRRIRLRSACANFAEREAFQFSLWQLFTLTLFSAVALAVVRFARETNDITSDAMLFFWLFPLLNAFVLLPLLSPWAALGAKHAGRRCLAIVLLALVSGVSPAFVGKATATTYGMLAGPLVLQSLVVTGSLLIARWLGYRFVSRNSFESRTRIYRYPRRFSAMFPLALARTLPRPRTS